MMDSQQPEDGEFPPNPFLSNPDDVVGINHSGYNSHASDGFGMQSLGSVQQQLPMPVPPAPSSGEFEPSSFAPVDSGYVGSGTMDSSFSGAGGNNEGSARGGATNVAAEATTRGAGLFSNAQRCCSVDTYRAYYDVDTTDIANRIVASITMCNIPDGFRHNALGVNGGKGPDLYGPFWITTTLVFFLAVTSNMHSYLHADAKSFEADISHLVHALWVLYTYSFVLPGLLFVVFRCFAIQMPLMELVNLYGYSLIPYYGAAVLCLIPAGWLEWLVLLAATCVSCLLILRNVAGPVLSSGVSQEKAAIILGKIMGYHVLFLLAMKFMFYHHK
uniref:Protein YIPF n=1 Tax=Trieres chinensis TaxID=1514140 RepID=A0A7S2A9M3_TRICV